MLLSSGVKNGGKQWYYLNLQEEDQLVCISGITGMEHGKENINSQLEILKNGTRLRILWIDLLLVSVKVDHLIT